MRTIARFASALTLAAALGATPAWACPNCKEVDRMSRACDQPGCWKLATRGIGDRKMCDDHDPCPDDHHKSAGGHGDAHPHRIGRALNS